MGAARGNYVMAFAGVIGTIGSDRTDVLVKWNLAKQLRQHLRVADITGGDLHGPDLQHFLVDPNMYLV